MPALNASVPSSAFRQRNTSPDPPKKKPAKEAPWNGAKAEDAIVGAASDLIQSLTDEFADRDKLYKDIDAVIYGELPVDIPEAYKKTSIVVRSPLPIHITTTVASALSVNPATVQYKPISFSDIAQQNASLREHFFEASWLRQQQEARRQLQRLFMWSLVTKGEGVLKTLPRTHAAWGDYTRESQELWDKLKGDHELDDDAKDRVYHGETEEMKLKLPYPIGTTDVSPETFYYTQNENGFTSCVELKQVPYYDALERFRAGMDRNGHVIAPEEWGNVALEDRGLARAEWADTMKGTNQSLSCLEVWDAEMCAVILCGPGQMSGSRPSFQGGTLVSATRHPYGDPILKTLRGPYFHALGVTTNSRLPERAGLSILFGFLRLFPLLDSLLTAQGNAAIMTAFPAFKRTLAPGSVPGIPDTQLPFGKDGREAEASDRIEPGTIYPYDIAPIDQPRSGMEAEKLIKNITGFLELALPSVIQGASMSGQSGYAINQAAHMARLAWDPIVDNAQTAMGMRTSFESWLIEHEIGENVYAWSEDLKPGKQKSGVDKTRAGWLSIGPDDLKGNHRYTISLDPSTPSDDIVSTRALAEKMQLRLISYEDAVEAAGGNPDEVERSWLVQDLKKSPEIAGKIKEQVLQKLATIQTAALPPEMQGGPPGAPMGPGGPPPAQPPGPIGTPGAPPMGPIGGPPVNPVPSPGQGMPLVPGMPPARQGPGPGSGGVSGMPQVPAPAPPPPF